MKVFCLFLGHSFWWLDAFRVNHCLRCGKPNHDWFEQQRRLQFIRDAGRKQS